jgi:hypothetical protein
VAQNVAVLVLEPSAERVFHYDSYGYRPGRSPIDAIRVCRERCWRRDWVVDLDVRDFATRSVDLHPRRHPPAADGPPHRVPWCPRGDSHVIPEVNIQTFRTSEVIVCAFGRIAPQSTHDDGPRPKCQKARFRHTGS